MPTGDKPRTGAKGLKTWLGNNQTGLVGASKASNLLQANIYVKTLNTSAICSASNNLVSSVKDATGQTESYTYGNRQSIMTGQPTAVKDANGKTTTIGYNDYGRVSQKTFANGGKLLYTYTNGLRTSFQRLGAALYRLLALLDQL